MKVPVIKTCAYSSVNRMIHIFKHVFKGIKNKDKNAFGPRRPTWPELIPCSFRSMKQLRVLLLPPGRDASPSQGYPQQYVASSHLYTWVKRDNLGQSILSKETTWWQGLGVKPPTFRSEVQRANHYTTTPPLFFKVYK